MPRATTISNTPADVLKWQSDMIRTKQYIPLGRMQKIAIGPSATYTPPEKGRDPIIDEWGRLIELRRRPVLIAQSADESQILICGYFLGDDNRAGLPDVPDPNWVAAPPSEEEQFGKLVGRHANGAEIREPVRPNRERVTPRMLPQRLEDRTNQLLDGTNYLVFSPVISATFQPELGGALAGTIWQIDFGYDPVTKTNASLLVDRATGEAHFFGGTYDIRRPIGEE